jgi:hypothetical protein
MIGRTVFLFRNLDKSIDSYAFFAQRALIRLDIRKESYLSVKKYHQYFCVVYDALISHKRPPQWSSGQSFWLQIQRFRVRFSRRPLSAKAGTNFVDNRRSLGRYGSLVD